MKKMMVLAAFFCVFWLLIPAGLIWLGYVLDSFFQFETFQDRILKQAGFGLAIVAGILFLTAVFQFRFLGKTWPVSA
ncbi:hypothetical protein JW935_01150, partial [candidate division KSB1 bacterium]|nr:hypothetical protein [candidate division KSB1 bacterium]